MKPLSDTLTDREPEEGTISGECEGRCEKTIVRQASGTRFDNLPFWCDECIEQTRRADRGRASEAAFRRRVSAAELPGQHHRNLDDLEHPDGVRALCALWGNGELPGLVLTGPIGVGKTTLAGASAYRFLHHAGLLWVPVSLLFARLATGFESDSHKWALEALSGDRAVVLDDMDKTRPSEYAAEQLFTAVDRRVERRISLLVTTNLGLSQLAERYPEPFGESVVSRLVGYCRTVKVDGADRRMGATR